MKLEKQFEDEKLTLYIGNVRVGTELDGRAKRHIVYAALYPDGTAKVVISKYRILPVEVVEFKSHDKAMARAEREMNKLYKGV